MLTNNTKTNVTSSGMDLSFFQRQLFYILICFLPWFVLPLPWDPTESIRVTFFIIISAIVILLEVVKWIWDGKVAIYKSVLDKAFLLLFLSFIISSIFAIDKWSAVWGFDGRLGIGIVSMSIFLTFIFLSRSFLNDKKYIVKSAEIMMFGISILIILSLISFFKVNIFGWIPIFKNFFVVGLPLTFYSKELVLIASGLILLSIYLVINYLREKKYQKVLLPFLATVVGFLAIPMFSINQGVVLPILIFIALVFTVLFLFIKLEKSLRFLPALVAILSVLSTVFAIGLQYDSFKDSLLGKSFEAVTPIQLASDISWSVSSRAIVEDLFRGLVGFGNESFPIVYSLFKPAVQSTLSLSNVSFITSSSEIFTTLATRGIIGVIVWILLGVVLVKTLINDLTTQNSEDSLLLSILQISTLVLYLGSFFVSYSFLLYFVFGVFALLSLMSRNIYSKNEEQFLLKFWAVNVGGVSQNIAKTINSVNWFLTSLMIVLVFAGLLGLGSKFVSLMYVARAEAFAAEETKKYTDEEDITLEVREEFFNNQISYYFKALRYDNSNPVANRKASTAAIEIMNVLSEIYQKSSEEEKSSILSEISSWKNTAIDLSREAITTSPYNYSNWYVRSSVYMGLLSIGLSDYSEDALFALQRCVNLNPLDFESYYRAGQIYMIKEDYEKALAAFDGGLRINGQHVPSLVLSARILSENGDVKTAVSYLEAAKRIMEVNKLQTDPMYESIVEALKEFNANSNQGSETLKEIGEDDLTEDLSPIY